MTDKQPMQTQIQFETKMRLMSANIWRRGGAYLIDLGIITLVVGFAPLPIGYIVSWLSLGDSILDHLITNSSWFVAILAICYFTILHAEANKGQTFGKTAMGIQVVDQNGRYLNRKQAFLRALAWLPTFLLVSAGSTPSGSPLEYIFALTSAGLTLSYMYSLIFNRFNAQTIHDYLVGSYVIRKQAYETITLPPLDSKHRFFVLYVPIIGFGLGSLLAILTLIFAG
ncbi:MAG: RDD family protein [Chloroflexota bacterium]